MVEIPKSALIAICFTAKTKLIPQSPKELLSKAIALVNKTFDKEEWTTKQC